MDIAKIAQNHTRILRHFVCDDCQVGLFIVTGDKDALLMRCPRCNKEFNGKISIAPLTNQKG